MQRWWGRGRRGGATVNGRRSLQCSHLQAKGKELFLGWCQWTETDTVVGTHVWNIPTKPWKLESYNVSTPLRVTLQKTCVHATGSVSLREDVTSPPGSKWRNKHINLTKTYLFSSDGYFLCWGMWWQNLQRCWISQNACRISPLSTKQSGVCGLFWFTAVQFFLIW